MLIAAIVLITSALAFYTVGVWGERFQRSLAWWHAVCFALGFAADLSGTLVMVQIAGAADPVPGAAVTVNTVMAVTGTIALVLMGLHLGAAVIILRRGRTNELVWFHRVSVIVWTIWLIPFAAGAVSSNIA